MKLKIITIIFFVLIIFFYLTISIFYYNYKQNEYEKAVDYCKKSNESYIDRVPFSYSNEYDEFVGVISDPDSCYCKMYSRLLPRLLVHKIKIDNKKLDFTRITPNSYILPTEILDKADVFISYGILNDSYFEYIISDLYKKNTYAYDCGVRSIDRTNPNLFFKSECIGTDKYLLYEDFGQKSSGKIHTFGEKIKELGLENKKIFLKMDIAGAEIEVIPDILNYSKNLTGMLLVIRIDNTKKLIKMNELLKAIEKDFVLVVRNQLLFESKVECNCNYTKDSLSVAISLTYINKDLINKDYIPIRQDYSNRKNYKQIGANSSYIPKFNINWILVISEKIKIFFDKLYRE